MAEFKNPNQQGGQDNSSFLIMMFVVLAVVFGIQWYHLKKNPQTAAPSSTPATATQPAAPAAVPAPVAAAAATPARAKAVAAAAVPAVQAAAEATTVIENELYRITFSNKGAAVRSWVLKRNPSTGESFTDNEGHPLDLVHDVAAAQYGYPMELNTADDALNARLKQLLYVSSATGTVEAPATVSFTYQDATLKVVKTFRFDPTYVVHADVQVTYNGQPVRAALSWPGGFGDQEYAAAYANEQVDTMSAGRTEHLAVKKVSGNAVLQGPFDWAGVSDPYFAAIFLPDQADTATLTTFRGEIDMARMHKGVAQATSGLPCSAEGKAQQAGAVCVPIVGAALAGAAGDTATRIYVGPKAMNVLKNVQSSTGRNLETVINFGFFGFIGKYLFVALQWIQAHIASNWGWAIIVLTVIINICLLPLRVQAMRSALKMQRIQPQVNAIKARYKNPKATDPKAAEMNAEVMKLYKENNVNMFGGCLPSLIPFPLLIAFYTMLVSVVELRHAHWFWLHDLTLPDATHVLPILMVISMFLVQFMTPSPGVDPQQQKMMAFTMPLVSGIFTWNYASGLALYWAVGNLISIATQMVMNRSGMGREMREIAAKRARKTQGKTIQGKR